MQVPKWMRVALFATAAMNMCGAFAFVPAINSMRNAAGFPAETHPLYLWVIAEFIFLFGVAYLACAVTARADRVLISIGAAGKLAFVGTISIFYLRGDLPLSAPLAVGGDLLFAILFILWLLASTKADA